MPLYFFDIDERLVDEQGVDLPDVAAAEAYAAGLASTFPADVTGARRRSVIVRTQDGAILATSDVARSGPDPTWAAQLDP